MGAPATVCAQSTGPPRLYETPSLERKERGVRIVNGRRLYRYESHSPSHGRNSSLAETEEISYEEPLGREVHVVASRGNLDTASARRRAQTEIASFGLERPR